MTTESRFRVGDKVRRRGRATHYQTAMVGDTAVVLAAEGGDGSTGWIDVRLDKNARTEWWSTDYAELMERPVSAQVAELEAELASLKTRFEVTSDTLERVSADLAAESRSNTAQQDEILKLRSQVRDLQRDQPPFTNAEASRIVGQVYDVLTGKIKSPNGQRDYAIPVYEPGSIHEHDGWRNYPSGVRTVRVSW
jgi:hypothetical protein